MPFFFISLNVLSSKFVTGVGIEAFVNVTLVCLNVKVQERDLSKMQFFC